MSDDSTSVQLNWIVIIPISLAISILISFLVWSIVLAYENFTKNIIFIIMFLMLIGFGTYRLVEYKYIQIDDKNRPKKELKSIIKQKIKNEINSKEFRIGLKIEVISLLSILMIIGFQSHFSSNLFVEVISIILGIFIIFFIPGYMIHRKLKQDNIRNKVNIIFFSLIFVVILIVIATMMLQLYQQIIPSFIISTHSTIFPEIDLSWLGLYSAILPFRVIFSKYAFRLVVLFAIRGSPSGTTTDNDRYPY